VSIQDEIPKSRLTLRYRTTISGAMQEVTLPFRMLVLADLSLGSSEDRKLDLSDRRLRPLSGRNLDPIIKDMKMSLRCAVKNTIDPANEEAFEVDLPITKMASFAPDEIAEHVPKIRALVLLKRLLLEMQASADNRKDVRKLLQEIYSQPELLRGLAEKLAEFRGLKLPEKSAAPAQ
jgi:type VI secretion system protein ImpB